MYCSSSHLTLLLWNSLYVSYVKKKYSHTQFTSAYLLSMSLAKDLEKKTWTTLEGIVHHQLLTLHQRPVTLVPHCSCSAHSALTQYGNKPMELKGLIFGENWALLWTQAKKENELEWEWRRVQRLHTPWRPLSHPTSLPWHPVRNFSNITKTMMTHNSKEESKTGNSWWRKTQVKTATQV